MEKLSDTAFIMSIVKHEFSNLAVRDCRSCDNWVKLEEIDLIEKYITVSSASMFNLLRYLILACY